ncbi:MAG: hypothetical protein J0H55_03560 [Chitinophagaceae bacterium]|nr:hypothetical protein [Chitinophagaceae bacterium]
MSEDPNEKTAVSGSILPKSEEAFIVWIVRNIFKNWIIFLLAFFVAAIAGFFYAASKTPIYQSHATFALEGESSGGLSTAASLASQFGISLNSSSSLFAGDNALQIMQSRRLIEETLLSIDTFDNKPITLIEYYRQKILGLSTSNNVHFEPGTQRSSFSYIQDSILYQTYLNFKNQLISISRPDNKASIYELAVKTPNERFTKIFTDSLISKTNQFYTDISSKKAKNTLDVLEQRVQAMKNKFDVAVGSQATMEDANLNTAFAKGGVGQTIQLTNSKVYGEAYAELFKNLEVARFQYLNSIPLFQIIDRPAYPLEKITSGKIKTAVIFGGIAVLLTGFFILIVDFLKKIRNRLS